MEVIRDALRVPAADIGWHERIQTVADLGGFALGFRVEVTDLTQGMDPCVGTTARMDPHPSGPQDLVQGRLDELLDRRPIGLKLPPAVRRTVVLQVDPPGLHFLSIFRPKLRVLPAKDSPSSLKSEDWR